jgi:hypothetical protein
VVDRGLKGFTHVEAASGFAGDWTARKVRDDKAYVVLGGDSGGVMCYFSSDDRSEAAAIEEGQRITLSGDYGSSRKSPRGRIVLLWNCSVED